MLPFVGKQSEICSTHVSHVSYTLLLHNLCELFDRLGVKEFQDCLADLFAKLPCISLINSIAVHVPNKTEM